ncbi:DUF1656 domain-containing protein [Azospirillum picis]|uniref:DUF1656 domain-containing protein n=1 Tax=Azospirillum picis TaxID=488438 RepID=A0ABU0MLH7_9PROT|nr:DUF1656 domain-containing protein [Azospirillum picis]MBP2301060.1 hypothetical protein [Azospirillum picis]MDQ0534320.1 hypothetical protein [Azospirillum picis]
MIGEIDIYGLFLPPLLVLAIVAWAVSALLRRVVRTVGGYRWIWHAPLFDLALYVVVLSGLAALWSQLG